MNISQEGGLSLFLFLLFSVISHESPACFMCISSLPLHAAFVQNTVMWWWVTVPCALPTLRGFCVISSRLVDSRLSFMATYRCLPSSSGSRECRSPAARGSIKRRPFWISSVQKRERETKGFYYYYYSFFNLHKLHLFGNAQQSLGETEMRHQHTLQRNITTTKNSKPIQYTAWVECNFCFNLP